jgi:hypothetical protein
MPAILLGSKTSWRRLGRTGASPKTTAAPKSLSGPLSGPPVEMLSVNRRNRSLSCRFEPCGFLLSYPVLISALELIYSQLLLIFKLFVLGGVLLMILVDRCIFYTY